MPDKFPEAFARYERKGTLKQRGITTFDELLVSFGVWGQSRAPLTRLQTKSLAKEAKKRDVKEIKTSEVYTQKGVLKTRYRDPLTGRFAKGEPKPPKERKPREPQPRDKNGRFKKRE